MIIILWFCTLCLVHFGRTLELLFELAGFDFLLYFPSFFVFVSTISARQTKGTRGDKDGKERTKGERMTQEARNVRKRTQERTRAGKMRQGTKRRQVRQEKARGDKETRQEERRQEKTGQEKTIT